MFSSSQEAHQDASSSSTEATVEVAEKASSTTTSGTTTIPITVTKKTSSSSLTSPSTWTLLVGIEKDIEQALIKTAVGVVAGGVLGVVFMRSGNGRRVTAMATGMGAAVGSTYERVSYRYEQQQQQNS